MDSRIWASILAWVFAIAIGLLGYFEVLLPYGLAIASSPDAANVSMALASVNIFSVGVLSVDIFSVGIFSVGVIAIGPFSLGLYFAIGIFFKSIFKRIKR
ncbi:MAG: hypothetical protein VXY77_01825 [Pseudomonadota bacterium]|nr:hypothetical protein [Pseudomonadota bacterium]